jgi:hypothetical protein
MEGTSFLVAGVIHRSVFIYRYEPRQASLVECSLAIVLLVAFGLTWIWPAQTRLIGLAAQAFALLGTLVGAEARWFMGLRP